MKYLRQFGIILFITFLSEMLNQIIPLSIPASIYGLVLMIIALVTKIIKVEQVEHAGKFLIEIMPLMFIAPAVSLIGSWSEMSSFLIQIIAITFVSTVAVMVVTGKVVQKIVEKDGYNK